MVRHGLTRLPARPSFVVHIHDPATWVVDGFASF
jgi:hypothetical protein